MTTQTTQTLEFFDVLGGRFTLSPAELVVLLRHKTTLTYLTLVYILLVVTDMPDLWGAVAAIWVLLLWAVVIVVFHAAVWLVVSLVDRLQLRVGARVWPGPMIVIASLTPAMLVGQGLAHLFSDGTVWFQFVPDVLLYWLIAESFGLIYFWYVRPHVDGPPAPVVPDERRVVIGAEPVALSRLRHIEAREHHVRVTLDDQSLTQRARLGDIVAQTTPEDGLQPHRSWWVAAGAVGELRQEGSRHILHLADGTRVPVARSRVEDVRTWLDRHACTPAGLVAAPAPC